MEYLPWYIGENGRIRAATAADIRAGLPYLRELLCLLPRLKMVVLVGRKAGRARASVESWSPPRTIVGSCAMGLCSCGSGWIKSRRRTWYLRRRHLLQFRVAPGENDEGAATLVGIRADGRPVPLAGMSDGTLDQLYLAIRIASLEHYFSAHDAAPFIIDDILLNFDDERATAAMTALDELAEKTQVILFTHHQPIVELARRYTKALVATI